MCLAIPKRFWLELLLELHHRLRFSLVRRAERLTDENKEKKSRMTAREACLQQPKQSTASSDLLTSPSRQAGVHEYRVLESPWGATFEQASIPGTINKTAIRRATPFDAERIDSTLGTNADRRSRTERMDGQSSSLRALERDAHSCSPT